MSEAAALVVVTGMTGERVPNAVVDVGVGGVVEVVFIPVAAVVVEIAAV